MEIINIVVAEIVACLVVAWVLGFSMAWIFFGKASKNYRAEIEELEENLSYSTACNRSQEKEIIKMDLALQELKKSKKSSKTDAKKVETTPKKPTKEKREGDVKITRTKEEIDMLKNIEENLYSLPSTPPTK